MRKQLAGALKWAGTHPTEAQQLRARARWNRPSSACATSRLSRLGGSSRSRWRAVRKRRPFRSTCSPAGCGVGDRDRAGEGLPSIWPACSRSASSPARSRGTCRSRRARAGRSRSTSTWRSRSSPGSARRRSSRPRSGPSARSSATRMRDWEEQNALVAISGAILDKRRKDLDHRGRRRRGARPRSCCASGWRGCSRGSARPRRRRGRGC